LKNQQEIIQKANTYKRRLAEALKEKDSEGENASSDIDLIIFALVDKLEMLFWVLDIELSEGDLIDRLHYINH
jgi:hypothetical protein